MPTPRAQRWIEPEPQEVPLRECLRCGSQWIPRRRVSVKCPRCGSPYWDRAREDDLREE